MKGHQQQQHSSPLLLPPKRRCTTLAAAVPALVVCSILLPLVFLLGLHRPGYESEERAAVVITTELAGVGARNKQHLENGGAMKHKLLKDVSKKKTSRSNGVSPGKPSREKSKNLAVKSKAKLKGFFSLIDLNNDTFNVVFQDCIRPKNINGRTCPGDQGIRLQGGTHKKNNVCSVYLDTAVNGKENHGQETVHEGNPKSCEHEYGSYCIWSTEHREVMKDAIDSGSIVFHLFTDAQIFYAMKHWFDRNSYLEATVHVTNIEDHQKIPKDADPLEMEQIWPSEEFRVTIRNYSEPPQRQMRTEYISVFGHLQYLLPDLLPSLNRVVVLDDDLVVQKDLSYLWNLDMDGKVIGAIQFCGVTLGQLRSYTGEHSFNSDACVWLSGLNLIELEKWRGLRVTSMYDQSLQKLQMERLASKRLKALPVSILAFQDLIYPLEESWVQSGLGHNYGISQYDIEKAATLHYNGVMKPWLDLGIHDYKSYWRKYMATGEKFMTECNIH
nr:unnamed protein product [Digitaria exilis]